MSEKIPPFPKQKWRPNHEFIEEVEEWRVETERQIVKRLREINRNYADTNSRLMAKSDLILEILKALGGEQ